MQFQVEGGSGGSRPGSLSLLCLSLEGLVFAAAVLTASAFYFRDALTGRHKQSRERAPD